MTSRSLEYSIKKAVKYYSSLFILPSYREVVLLTFLLCLSSGLSIFLFFQKSVILVLQFSLLVFLMSTASDFLIRQTFLRSDPIYNTRRCAALSMFSVLLLFGFLLIGSILTNLFNSWIFFVNLYLVGFSAVCILRLIVLFSTSFTTYWKTVSASLTQPLMCLLPMLNLVYSIGYNFANTKIVFLLVSAPATILIALIFIKAVDEVGIHALHTSTTTILKAFLANWMENLNKPLERLFENFGKEKDIDFSLLAFKAENRTNSMLVVSSFHPGPFRNVGSSNLPFTIQDALEKRLDCVASIPHGLFGHEFDLASQKQNKKVLEGIINSAEFTNFASKATNFARKREGIASASCQIFGECAIVTLTLAPETTEDFPQEVGDFVIDKASKLGLKHVILINAHNSINNLYDVDHAIEFLKEAAFNALKKAFDQKPSYFEVGSAKIVPKEFDLEHGMGPGGICALVVRVSEQTCAYVTIDGNNMVSGLREKIASSLEELRVNECEVLTTDTHAVNAIVTNARGYHPLGDAIPHDKLIFYIRTAVKKALDELKPTAVAWRVGKVPNVKVIGEAQIQEMSHLADEALQRAKRTAIPLFLIAGLLFISLLFLI